MYSYGWECFICKLFLFICKLFLWCCKWIYGGFEDWKRATVEILHNQEMFIWAQNTIMWIDPERIMKQEKICCKWHVITSYNIYKEAAGQTGFQRNPILSSVRDVLKIIIPASSCRKYESWLNFKEKWLICWKV